MVRVVWHPVKCPYSKASSWVTSWAWLDPDPKGRNWRYWSPSTDFFLFGDLLSHCIFSLYWYIVLLRLRIGVASSGKCPVLLMNSSKNVNLFWCFSLLESLVRRWSRSKLSAMVFNSTVSLALSFSPFTCSVRVVSLLIMKLSKGSWCVHVAIFWEFCFVCRHPVSCMCAQYFQLSLDCPFLIGSYIFSHD